MDRRAHLLLDRNLTTDETAEIVPAGEAMATIFGRIGHPDLARLARDLIEIFAGEGPWDPTTGIRVAATCEDLRALLGSAIAQYEATADRGGLPPLWRRMLATPLSPRVSVLVPAYNEAVTVVDSVSTLLALTYPNLEVVVVNDGSSDATLDRLIGAFDLTPIGPAFRRVLDTAPVKEIYRSPRDARLVVVDKHNGGKADSLNAAVNVASGELVCAIDADTLVAVDALQQLASPFLTDSNTVAVGGTIRLVNGANRVDGQIVDVRAPRRLLVGAQVVEYTRSFLVGRIGWGPLVGNLIISGAFGLFDRAALVEINGYEHDSVGEDMELIVRLRRTAYERGFVARVEFSPDPVAFTEAPESLRTLARQRNRWFRGLLDVLVRHRRMILRREYGSAGMLALPYFLVVEALAPVLELVGLATLIVV
ncbi:MAG: glycosyltransferase family 2 protein, partial [Acidimicrobiia bacterium]|nr:glycosyltransferase family 2 protein [Acidimicrobiia bacterium]